MREAPRACSSAACEATRLASIEAFVESTSTFNEVTFHNNTALSAGASGGSMYLVNIDSTMVNCSIAHSAAALFGGGIALGEGSCGLIMKNTHVTSNHAVQQGQQLYSASGGNLSLLQASELRNDQPGFGLFVTQAGLFNMDRSSAVMCPNGTEFSSAANQIPGPHSVQYPDWSIQCSTSACGDICSGNSTCMEKSGMLHARHVCQSEINMVVK